MRVVIKLGGSLLTDKRLLKDLVRQTGEIQGSGHDIILVHGGGKHIKQYLDQLGVPSRFHKGLRVTDQATMQVVQMVLAGLVNKEIVATLGSLKVRAAGLCGGDGMSFLARKYQDKDFQDREFDYGFVGEVYAGDPILVNLLLQGNYVPVIACIAVDSQGIYYNVNADEMAAAVAIFCQVDRLVFLTDVPGVLDQNQNVISALNRVQLRELRDCGVISEGMLPKTRACERALEEGIRQVNIVGGKEPEGLSRVLLHGESLGTAIH